MAKNDFQYGGWNHYTLVVARSWHGFRQVTAPCNVACGSVWNHDSEFTKWQHNAMWYVALWGHAVEFAQWQHRAMWQVALGWHAMEFVQTFAILKFYIWFRFWPYHRSRHVILHQSAKFYPNRTTLSRKKRRRADFQDGGSQPSWISGVQ